MSGEDAQKIVESFLETRGWGFCDMTQRTHRPIYSKRGSMWYISVGPQTVCIYRYDVPDSHTIGGCVMPLHRCGEWRKFRTVDIDLIEEELEDIDCGNLVMPWDFDTDMRI